MLLNMPDFDFADEVIFYEGTIKIDKEMRTLEEVIQRIKPKLLILDPFYTIHSKDENKSSDMAPLLFELRKMIVDNGIACLMVHHQGKKGELSHTSRPGFCLRGSSSFADVRDGSISLTKKSDSIFLLATEFRNQEPLEELILELDKESLTFTTKEPTSTERVEFHLSREQLFCDILKDAGTKLSNSDLIARSIPLLKLSKRSCQDVLKRAVESGLILKDTSHKNVFYSLPVSATGASPLEDFIDCTDDLGDRNE